MAVKVEPGANGLYKESSSCSFVGLVRAAFAGLARAPGVLGEESLRDSPLRRSTVFPFVPGGGLSFLMG